MASAQSRQIHFQRFKGDAGFCFQIFQDQKAIRVQIAMMVVLGMGFGREYFLQKVGTNRIQKSTQIDYSTLVFLGIVIGC